MNLVLWIVAGLLALAFVAAGVMKLTQPKDRLATSGMRWPALARDAEERREVAPGVTLGDLGDVLRSSLRDHEPALALYGGEEGYEFYAGLIAQSAERLRPGGLLVLELGHNSLAAVQPLLEPPTWTNVGVTNDLAGIPRVISAERA